MSCRLARVPQKMLRFENGVRSGQRVQWWRRPTTTRGYAHLDSRLPPSRTSLGKILFKSPVGITFAKKKQRSLQRALSSLHPEERRAAGAGTYNVQQEILADTQPHTHAASPKSTHAASPKSTLRSTCTSQYNFAIGSKDRLQLRHVPPPHWLRMPHKMNKPVHEPYSTPEVADSTSSNSPLPKKTEKSSHHTTAATYCGKRTGIERADGADRGGARQCDTGRGRGGGGRRDVRTSWHSEEACTCCTCSGTRDVCLQPR